MKKIFQIDGMHCVSCEILLQQACTACKGCTVERVDHKKGLLHVTLSDERAEHTVKKAVTGCGYRIVEDNDSFEGSKSKTVDERIQTIALFAMIAFIVRAVSKTEVMQYIPSIGDDVSVGIALLVGLIASVSTCLAVTGWLVVGFSRYVDTSSWRRWHLNVQGSFHIGRIVWFGVFWALLGLLGKWLTISLGAQGLITLLVGLVFFYIGLSMLGIAPNITKLWFYLPPSRTRRLHTATNPYLAPVVGALTFFLPCGFTQSMQLLALGSGSPFQGGIIMAAFALGTLPVLLAVGLGSSYTKDRKRPYAEIILWSILVIFGVSSLQNAAALFGVPSQVRVSVPTAQNIVVDPEALVNETLTVSHNGRETVPGTIELTAGKNYTLTIVPSSNGIGCMSTLVVPTIDKTVHRIIKDQPIVYTLTNLQPWVYPIVCSSMGMRQGEIRVQ